MAPAGKVERLWKVTVARWRQAPALCPCLASLAHACAPAGAGTGAFSRSPLEATTYVAVWADRAMAGSRWRSTRPAAVWRRAWGRCACVPVCGRNEEQTSRLQRRTAPLARCSPHWLAPRRSYSSSPSVARTLCTETSTCLFPGHGRSSVVCTFQGMHREHG